MGNALDARSAREALIVEALRGVDTALAAADAVGERLSASSQRLESAAAGLTAAGTVYSAEVAQLTEATKKALAALGWPLGASDGGFGGYQAIERWPGRYAAATEMRKDGVALAY